MDSTHCMPGPQRLCAGLAIATALAVAAGCTSFSHTNQPLAAQGGPTPPLRASFQVDGARGNPKVLMFLALSGGGSRAAYLSAATMLKLQTLYPEVDLLDEVDVLSSVSGGSITAALYAASRDVSIVSPALATSLPPLIARTPLEPQIKVDPRAATIRCSAPLGPQDLQALQARLPALRQDLRRLDTLCRQAPLTQLQDWKPDAVLGLARRNYLLRWFGNWLWPQNIARYWFTAYDRGDIMAQTLGDNLYGTRLIGNDLAFGELNPTRPFLLVNATTATDQSGPGLSVDEYAFGSVFTFTEQDFRDRLNADLGRYSLARAVTASSSFPLVFPSHTLQDFRPGALDKYCEKDRNDELKCTDRQYLHVFDGGNSDNLGLKSVKRALFQLEAAGQLKHYDRIVVLLVDAFTRPRGASRLNPDPRGTLGLLLDANVSDAVDALLQNNRGRLLGEFDGAELGWNDGSCEPETRELPSALCRALNARPEPVLDLSQRLVFYHFGFDDVAAVAPQHAGLKRKLDTIPTSFKLAEGDARLLDEAVELVISPANPCLQRIRDLVLAPAASPEAIVQARKLCRRTEGQRSTPSVVPAGTR
ncbi:patatin-like phospholipase family protein [Piscinibacter sp. HJYY11]|uniref:patatin-like phospholipase family protein n=1 Tax=Piscinibacter sp. HJYY11 TaxID=2801333 RepID=UPI00191CE020|nr:patatin-like phospholipase family protein [Piscinibacter sp. HJYY11]MBL0730375.1 patatin-like phospholipase family protein [Piscinibacter sp. HJYY11]